MEIENMKIKVRAAKRGYISVVEVIADGQEIGYIFKAEGHYRIKMPNGTRRLSKGYDYISEAIGAIITHNLKPLDGLDLPLDDLELRIPMS